MGENMDIFYIHQFIRKALITKFYNPRAGTYHERGWTTWEQTCVRFLTHPLHIRVIGHDEEEAIVNQFNHLPVTPEDFAAMIRKKRFTEENDLEQIIQNYQKNFLKCLSIRERIQWAGVAGGSCPWGDDEAVRIAKCIQHLNYPKLKEFVVSNHQIRDRGAQALAKCIPRCPELRELRLSIGHIGDLGAQALAHALPDCKVLENFDLSKNQIGKKGAQALVHALPDCKALKKCNLLWNQIGHQELWALRDWALAHLHSQLELVL